MDLVTVVRGVAREGSVRASSPAVPGVSRGHHQAEPRTPGLLRRAGSSSRLERGQGEAFACRAAPGAQAALVASDPTRFFAPLYLAHLGWIGVNFDGADWMEIAELVDEAYRLAAPKKLVALLDE